MPPRRNVRLPVVVLWTVTGGQYQYRSKSIKEGSPGFLGYKKLLYPARNFELRYYNHLILIDSLSIILYTLSRSTNSIAPACPILKRTLAAMFKLAPFYLFACSVAAVKFYGHTPSADVHTDTLNRMAEALEDGLGYGSMFISSDLTSKNGSDFLAEMGISDTTLEEFLAEGSGPHASTVPSTSASPSDSLRTRDPANQLNCQHNAVEDKISPKNQKHICSSLAGLVVTGVQGVAMLLDSQGCAEASSGHKVVCKTMVALISGGGGFISGTEVLDYCTA